MIDKKYLKPQQADEANPSQINGPSELPSAPTLDLGRYKYGTTADSLNYKFGCSYFIFVIFFIILAFAGVIIASFASWTDGSSGNAPGLSCFGGLLFIFGPIGAIWFLIRGSKSIIRYFKND